MTLAVPTFPTLLQRFFTQRLMQEKQVSPNTIQLLSRHVQAAAAVRTEAAAHRAG